MRGVDVGELEIRVGNEGRVKMAVNVESPGGLVVMRVLMRERLAHG